MTTVLIIAAAVVFTLLILLTLILFFRGSKQKPLRYESPRFGLLTAGLLRLSGHHPTEFERLPASVAWRFAACGLSVIVPPCMAFFGVLLASTVFNLGAGLALATAAGLFILLLDFVLVATLGASTGVRAGWLLAVYRALLAFGIGWFIARPPILLIYGGAIDGLNRANRWEEIRRTTEEREGLKRQSAAAHQPLAEHYAAQREMLETELKAVIASKVPINQRIMEQERQREDEHLRGREGRKPGTGNFFDATVGYLNEEKGKLQKVEQEEARLRSELATLATSQDEQLRKANDDPANKALGDAATKQIVELKNATAGWSEREDLMIKWVLAEPVKRLPGFLVIHLLLLLLDLLPLLTMLFVPRAELEKARLIQGAQLAAEAECAERLALEHAEEIILERLTRDRLRERIAILKEAGDLRLDFAAHQILRTEQAEAAVRPHFLKLRFGSSNATQEQEALWQEAANPLRRAMARNLGDFETLVG